MELVIVVAHAGHGGAGEDGEGPPRMRGSSKAMGDADAFWFYQHAGKHGQLPPDSRRYFRAFGRDINVENDITLDYDSTSRRLHVVEGSGGRVNDQIQQMARKAYDAVSAHVHAHGEPLSGKKKLEDGMGKGKTDWKRDGIARAAELGWIEFDEQGAGRATLYDVGPNRPETKIKVPMKGRS